MADGSIKLKARAQIPATWDKLANSTLYGPQALESRVAYVKYSLFGTVALQQDEDSFYDLNQQEYAAKLIAIQVIPAGIDWYKDQLQTAVMTGTNESKTYPDRISALQRLYTNLLVEIESMRGVVVPRARRKMRVPTIDSNGPFRTPDPNCFPRFGTTGTPVQTGLPYSPLLPYGGQP